MTLPIPAPVELLRALLIAAFALHAIPMSLAMGGSVIAAVTRLVGSDEHATAARRLEAVVPVATALAITFGVAALLFAQSLYTPAFMTASALSAWPWMSILPTLIVAYLSSYALAFHGAALGRRGHAVAVVGALAYLGVAWLFAHHTVLVMQPAEEWHRRYDASGTALLWREPLVWARWAHVAVASVAVAGLAFGLTGKDDFQRRYGAGWFAFPTLAQLAIGWWTLLSHPEPVRQAFLGGEAKPTVVLACGVGFGVLGAVLAMAAWARPSSRVPLRTASVCLLGAICFMAMVRQMARDRTIGLPIVPEETQGGPLAAFGAAAATAAVVVAWMLSRLHRGTASERVGAKG